METTERLRESMASDAEGNVEERKGRQGQLCGDLDVCSHGKDESNERVWNILTRPGQHPAHLEK